MSKTPDASTKQSTSSNPVPAWMATGLLGIAIGAGGAVLTLQALGYQPEKVTFAPPGAVPAMPPPGMGGMGGGGGGGGGGGAPGKRNLTSLVGKLELLSRPDLNLRVELTPEQAQTVAAKLAELDKAETMTAEEADAHLAALEEVLTPQQKETLGLVGLPSGRPGGAGGGGTPGARPPGTGGPPAAAPGPGGPPGGAAPDANPFAQEANQKRLKDLLARLGPADGETAAPPSTDEPAPPKSASPEAADEEKK